MTPARRAFGLLVASVWAKVLVVALVARDGGARGVVAPLLPFALVADALVVAAVVHGIDRLAARTRGVGAVLFGALLAYTAANVPIARVLGTPLNVGFLVATGGALTDSIATYVTASNLASVVSVIVVGVLAARRGPADVPPRVALGLGAAGLGLVLLGPIDRLPPLGRTALRHPLFAMGESVLRRAIRGDAADPGPPPFVPAARGADVPRAHGVARGRSVVWLVLESTGAKHLGLYGAPDDPMPATSRVFGGSHVIEAAYAPHPESIKGFFAEICADVPAPNRPAEAHGEAARPCRSIAHALRDAGYRTGLFHSGYFAYLGMKAVVAGRGFEVEHDATNLSSPLRTSFGADDRVLVDDVLGFVDQTHDRPFFAMVLPIAGHHPYRSPGRGPRPREELGDLDAYRNDLQQGDAALDALYRGLEARGLLDQIVLVVSGDHGEAFHEHPGNLAHSLFVYEENLRVPLAFRAQGLAPARIAAPASVIDVAPSILDLVGVAPPAPWAGRSLFGARPALPVFFVDQTAYLAGLRDGPTKVVFDVHAGRTELYDLATDPGETRDLSGAEPARAAKYRDWLLRFLASRGGR